MEFLFGLGMLIYKGKVLTKFKNKKSGKNQGEVDGFYRDSDGVEYFIKKPNDPKELFTELFAGLLLQEFIRRQLIDKIYHASFITAQLIQFEDGSYGLIQPKIEFKELYKIIGTGYRDGSDRDPLVEMFYGPQSYLLLTQLKSYFGLAIALMFSLLFGDNSVHSGNVVCLDVLSSVEMMFIQFARIDWGAAFRYYGHKKNNENLLNPFEYQGWFNPKGYTKGYFLNYKKIKGLFPAIAEQAFLLQKKVNESLFVEIINSVLRQLPVHLVDNKTKLELAQYLCIESFGKINFGVEDQQFAVDLAHILFNRLDKMTTLQDFPDSAVEADLPQVMYAESIPTAIGLPVNIVIPFNQQMSIWLNILSLTDERSIFDFNSIDRTKLVKQYNFFMDALLRQVEQLELLLHYDGTVEDEVRHLSISHSFRNQFALDMDLKPTSSDTAPSISYKKPHRQLVEAVLTTSFNAIITIRVIQSTQATTMLASASAIHFLFDALKMYLHDFNATHTLFLKEVQDMLLSMSGTQLARVCLNEMEFINSSLLIGIVLKNPELWERMNQALTEEYEIFYQEKIDDYLVKLRKCHADYTLFLTLVSESLSISQLATKKLVVDKLNSLFESLPEFLQKELAALLNQIQDDFRGLQRRHSLKLEELEQLQLNEQLLENNNDSLEEKNNFVAQTDKKETDVKECMLYEKISTDKILWQAIVESQSEELPLDDLLVLKNFYDRKREECTDVSGEALSIFYTHALMVRLSDSSLTEQAHIILYDALKTFDTSKKSTILNEAIHLVNVLFNKVGEVKPQMINRSLFFSRHNSGALFVNNNPSQDHSVSSSGLTVSSTLEQ
ncbi:LepB GTPase-activating domain-containing protein [Legionella parisiensis]|nr:LepB GTPase-activating domain-containing protein [Legionella parisiensis]